MATPTMIGTSSGMILASERSEWLVIVTTCFLAVILCDGWTLTLTKLHHWTIRGNQSAVGRSPACWGRSLPFVNSGKERYRTVVSAAPGLSALSNQFWF